MSVGNVVTQSQLHSSTQLACVGVKELIPSNTPSLSLIVDEWLGGQELGEKLQNPEALQCVYHSN